MSDSSEGAALAPPVPPIAISGRYASCLMSFSEHLAALNRSSSSSPSAIAAQFEETRIERALKEYGRVRMWGEETRAALPAASRGSLDDTLRKDNELKGTVADILTKVEEQVQHATRMMQPAQNGDDNVQDYHSESSDSEESTEPSSDEDAGQDDDASPSRMHPLLRLYRHIKEDIDSLYQVSLLISRPGYNRQYVHSTGQSEWDSRVAHYAAFDARYVEEKILDWKRQEVQAGQESIATPDIIRNRIMSSGFPSHTKSLAQRLAKANTKRREQLMYWSKHPDQAPTTAPSSKPTVTVQDCNTYLIEEPDKMPELRVEEATPSELLLDRESQGPRSTMTRNTFSTVVVSDVFGPRTVAGPTRTIYAESTVGNKRSNRVPDVPSSAFKHEVFECPYCHLTLTSKQMQNRLEWKRHVFRDLRPYVCTFEGCQNSDKQYLKRHDWIFHETQMHRRRWVCVDHDTSFASKALFIDHVYRSHSTSITPQQLPVLVEMSERPTNEMEIVACPLCPDERQLILLQSHLAEHLESIALFVLPFDAAKGDEENGNPGGAGGGNSSSTVYDPGRSSSLPSSDNVSDPNFSHSKSQVLVACDACHYEWATFQHDDTCPQCDSTSIHLVEGVPRSEQGRSGLNTRADNELYATDGPKGIKVVADPPDVQSSNASSESHISNTEQRTEDLDLPNLPDDEFERVNIPETAHQSWDDLTSKFTEAREGKSAESPRFKRTGDHNNLDFLSNPIARKSDFEIVGVVLGSIPLIISALEHYEDGLAVMKNMKVNRWVFTDIMVSFTASMGIYMDSCYQLLRPLNLPDKHMNDLLEERKREAWKTPQLWKDLKMLLGPECEVYLSLVYKLNSRILLLCKKLKLNDDLKPPWVGPDGEIDEKARRKFFQNTWMRIRGGFDSSRYAKLLQDIDSDVYRISKLAAGPVQLEPLRAEKKSRLQSTYRKNIRDQAQILFENLNSRFHPCSCQHLHKANLRLDFRKGYDVEEDTVRFAFLLTFERSSCGPNAFPWDWRDIEIETSQCSNAPATISPLQSSTYVTKTSVPFAPSITVSPSTSSQPTQHSSPPAIASKIDNLCNALMQSYSSKCYIGFLEDQPWQHHVYSVPGPGTSDQISEAISLKELIFVNKSKITMRERYTLALTLASAVLQLYNTPWLPKTWGTKDIFMLKTRTGSVLPSHFYVSRTFGSTTTTATVAKRRGYIKNETVFALGVALLELSFGQPLLSLQTPDDLNESGMEDSMTEVSIATRLAERIHEYESQNYTNAVRRCVRGIFDTFTSDFEDLEFREKFFEGVVVPLREDYEMFTDGKL